MEMATSADFNDLGAFDARYAAFLETMTRLRSSLHRYCSRMTGSVLDGEDIVQEALFQAYRKLDTFDDSRPMGPWLFRIAHNRCVDFLRHRGVREDAEAEVAASDYVAPVDSAGAELGRAIEHLVLTLPPKERACVLLKDVFDYSLEEISDLVDTTVGGVKAALNRGRTKLASIPKEPPTQRRRASPDVDSLLQMYVERFNRHDWDGLRQLIAADARLQVADRFSGSFADAPYFSQYERMREPSRMAVGEVDGEPVVVSFARGADAWIVQSVVRLTFAGDRIVQIADYLHCPWVLQNAGNVITGATPSG
jgi:RNA polymerase sigma-70 factor (ECF subfamily)